MAELMTCPACGREVAKDAANCPQCGKPIAQSWGRVAALVFVGAVVIVAAAKWMGLF